jgi:hypothetical protein
MDKIYLMDYKLLVQVVLLLLDNILIKNHIYILIYIQLIKQKQFNFILMMLF